MYISYLSSCCHSGQVGRGKQKQITFNLPYSHLSLSNYHWLVCCWWWIAACNRIRCIATYGRLACWSWGRGRLNALVYCVHAPISWTHSLSFVVWPNRSNSWVTLRTNPGLHGKHVSLSVHLTAFNLIFSWSVHDPLFFVVRIVNIAPNKWLKDLCLRSTSSLVSRKRQIGLWMSGVKLITGGETCWQSNVFYWRVRNWKATKMYYWWKAAPGKFRKLRTKICLCCLRCWKTFPKPSFLQTKEKT